MQATAAVASVTQSSCLHLAAGHALGAASDIQARVAALQAAQLDILHQSLHFAKTLARHDVAAGTGEAAAGAGARPQAEAQRAHAWSLVARCLRAAHWMQKATPNMGCPDIPSHNTAEYAGLVLGSQEGQEACSLLLQGSSPAVLPAAAPGGAADERSSAADGRATSHSPSHPALEAVHAALDVLVSTAGHSFAPVHTQGGAGSGSLTHALCGTAACTCILRQNMTGCLGVPVSCHWHA